MNSFNWVDYVVVVIFLGSILAGLMRGLVKEMIGLVTWVAAFVAAVMFASPLAAHFTGSDQVQSVVASASTTTGLSAVTPVSYISLGISFIAIFVGVLILGKFINYMVSSAVEGRGISFANRFLGGIFGSARGVLFVLVMMFIVQLSPFSAQPYWTQSQFVAYFQPAVQMIDDAVSPGLKGLKDKVGNTIKNTNPQQFIQGMNGIYQGLVK